MAVVASTSKAATIEFPDNHSTSISSMVRVVASLNCVGNRSIMCGRLPSAVPFQNARFQRFQEARFQKARFQRFQRFRTFRRTNPFTPEDAEDAEERTAGPSPRSG
jgi:hypothetical protein